MSYSYIIVEGPTDIQVLTRILPKAVLDNVRLVDGKGKYGAESLARSVAATRDVPVVLLIDADTTDETLITQKRQDVRFMVRQTSTGAPFHLLLAIPTIETVFFTDRVLLEQLIDRHLTDLEWQLGQRQPKDLLESVTGDSRKFMDSVLTQLSEEQVDILRRHPLIIELMAVLTVGMQAIAG
jgi:hypothetical protein